MALMLQHRRTCEDVRGVEKASVSQIVVKFCGNLGPLGHSEPLWAALGCFRLPRDLLRFLRNNFCSILGHLGTTFGNCEATLGGLGEVCGPAWGHFWPLQGKSEPLRSDLGWFWSHALTIWGFSESTLGSPVASFGSLLLSPDHFFVFLCIFNENVMENRIFT